MNRRAMVQSVTLGALVTGLVPLTGAGVGAAGTDDSPAAVCRSAFGDRGPGGGHVVGEGPPGDPMSVTVGWEPGDWPDGLREIVTCVSVDGRAVPSLAGAKAAPFSSGTITLDLTLPSGEPGALVCQQSVLRGAGGAADRHRLTSPVCFKLRAGDQPPPAHSGGRTTDSGAPARRDAGARSGGRPDPAGSPAPVGPPRGTRGAAGRDAVRSPGRSPVPDAERATPPARGALGAAVPDRIPPIPGAAAAAAPDSTPPARAAFEAALGASRVAAARTAPGPAPAAKPRGQAAGAKAGRPASGAPVPGAVAGTSPAALPRTGVEDRIPLAAAGSLLALGGAAIVLAEPRRRARPVRSR